MREKAAGMNTPQKTGRNAVENHGRTKPQVQDVNKGLEASCKQGRKKASYQHRSMQRQKTGDSSFCHVENP
jgi:hypothetical protein